MDKFIFVRLVVNEGRGVKYRAVQFTNYPFNLDEVTERMPALREEEKQNWCAIRLPQEHRHRKIILDIGAKLKPIKTLGCVTSYFLVRQFKSEEHVVYPVSIHSALKFAQADKIIGDMIFVAHHKGDTCDTACLGYDEEEPDLFGVDK